MRFRGVGTRSRIVIVIATGITFAMAAVSASAPPSSGALDVSVNGEGALTAFGGIDCGDSCVARYRRGALVTVMAAPSRNETFAGWGGECFGAAPTCTVQIGRSTRVRAVFARIPQKVRVTVGGSGRLDSDAVGQPTISGGRAGIRCGRSADDCSALFGQGVTIRLTPTPTAGSHLGGWGGACKGKPLTACDLTVGANEDVANQATAWFVRDVAAADPQALSVDAGGGRIVSEPAGIDCGAICTHTFDPVVPVTLTADDARWSGDCVGDGGSCTLVPDAPLRVAARRHPHFSGSSNGIGLKISISGNGRVTGSDRDIHCSRRSRAGCDTFIATKHVKLRAAPAARGTRFLGWRGNCSGRKPVCDLFVNRFRFVTAIFGH